ncbi:MAG: hypothetical protein IH872_02840 [Chloroflexi bacterium]|nr:hypothetical protein [Chloroflexota bacterium]
MEYRYAFNEVISALSPSYKSIDLRAILVILGDGKGWRCLFGVVRLSRKPQDDVEIEHSEIRQLQKLPDHFLRHSLSPDVNPQPFRGMNVELSSFGIDQLGGILNNFRDGKVHVRERTFDLWDAVASSDLAFEYMDRRDDPYAKGYEDWPTFFLGLGQQTDSLSADMDSISSIGRDDLNIWAREVGYSTYRDLCERILGVPWGQGNRFEIRAPIYAAVNRVDHSGNSIWVDGVADQKFNNLVLECTTSGVSGVHGTATPERVIGREDINEPVDRDGLIHFSKEFPADTIPESGYATAILFREQPIRFDLSQTKSRLRNGFSAFNVFTAFIPRDDVREYLDCLVSGERLEESKLFDNFKPKYRGKKRDELFEYVVVYLLGLCQLNPILLSNPQYDSLNGGLNSASADILALTPEKEPLLVSCTMAMPDVKKIGTLAAANTAISERLGRVSGQLNLLLVSGKPSVPHVENSVPTLGAVDLRAIWEMIENGDIRGTWNLMGLARGFQI